MSRLIHVAGGSGGWYARAAMSASVQNTGRITQILGPVIDVEFPPGGLPEVYTALKVTNTGISNEPDNLTIRAGRTIMGGMRASF